MPHIMKTVDVEVEFDLNDFNDDELIDELEDRGFRVYETNTKSQQDLIDRLQEDGYEIRKPGSSRHELTTVIGRLYDLYKDESMHRLFEKELKKSFLYYLDVNI